MRRPRILIGFALLLAGVACATGPATQPALSDEDFWRLSTSLSEPAGTFDQDNLVSNELLVAQFAQILRSRGGVYVGVGPEQNFTYIARLQPAVAFVLDIRKENLLLHLMYKALFELSPDRADFLARLFSRPRPSQLAADVSVAELFAAFDAVQPTAALLEDSKRRVRERLVDARRLPLSSDELATIDATLSAFFTEGPSIRYGRSLPPSRSRPSYRQLMTVTDLRGNAQSYLAAEASFEFVRELQQRNFIVPLVGNFASPTAIRRLGDHLRQNRQMVSAFYASNVEVYLTRDERRVFCASLATLPHDTSTYFIGNRRLMRLGEKLESCARIAPSLRWP